MLPADRRARLDGSHVTVGSVVSPAPPVGIHGRQLTVLRQAARPDSVALLVPARGSRVLGEPFFGDLVRGIADALVEPDLRLILELPSSAGDIARMETHLDTDHVCGVLVVAIHGDEPLLRRLDEHGVPIVICGQAPSGIRASTVDSDNRQGARLAVEHLLALGRTRIAAISGNLDQAAALDRRLGYREALGQAGIAFDPTLEEVAGFLPDRAAVAMERLLINHPDVDGVFAASDVMAAAAVQVLHQRRRRVPEDVAVIGFDDSPTALMTQPPLSTVRQHPVEMGRTMVSLLLQRLAEPAMEPQRVVFDGDLVVRRSSGSASA